MIVNEKSVSDLWYGLRNACQRELQVGGRCLLLLR